MFVRVCVCVFVCALLYMCASSHQENRVRTALVCASVRVSRAPVVLVVAVAGTFCVYHVFFVKSSLKHARTV